MNDYRRILQGYSGCLVPRSDDRDLAQAAELAPVPDVLAYRAGDLRQHPPHRGRDSGAIVPQLRTRSLAAARKCWLGGGGCRLEEGRSRRAQRFGGAGIITDRSIEAQGRGNL